MADRELIAATLAAGLLRPIGASDRDNAITSAMALFEQMLAAVKKRFPEASDNRTDLRTLSEE